MDRLQEGESFEPETKSIHGIVHESYLNFEYYVALQKVDKRPLMREVSTLALDGYQALLHLEMEYMPKDSKLLNQYIATHAQMRKLLYRDEKVTLLQRAEALEKEREHLTAIYFEKARALYGSSRQAIAEVLQSEYTVQ